VDLSHGGCSANTPKKRSGRGEEGDCRGIRSRKWTHAEMLKSLFRSIVKGMFNVFGGIDPSIASTPMNRSSSWKIWYRVRPEGIRRN
jgi:hypothetical protein